MLRRVLILTAAVLLAACAPNYTHLNDAAHGGDNHVTAITGVQSCSTVWNTSSSHNTRNYHGANWVDTRSGGADGVSRNCLEVTGSGVQNGTQGGTITYWNGSTNWDDWHYRSGLKVDQAQWVTDTMVIINEGDSIKFQAGSEDSRFSRGFVNGSHDDCLQADYGTSYVLEDSHLADCYSALSARPSGSVDASGHEAFIDHSIIEISDKDSCYNPGSYGCPNHAGFLKWEQDNPSLGLKFTAANSTFAALSYPEIGDLELNANIATSVDGLAITNAQACHDITLDFMGPSSENAAFLADAVSWQTKCPTGLVIKTGSAAVSDYFAKASAWHDAHDSIIG